MPHWLYNFFMIGLAILIAILLICLVVSIIFITYISLKDWLHIHKEKIYDKKRRIELAKQNDRMPR